MTPVSPEQGMLPSPCVGICRLDNATGWCLGCARDTNELASWRTLSARRAGPHLGRPSPSQDWHSTVRDCGRCRQAVSPNRACGNELEPGFALPEGYAVGASVFSVTGTASCTCVLTTARPSHLLETNCVLERP